MQTEMTARLREITDWLVTHQVSNKELYILAILISLALVVVLTAKKYRVPIVVGYVFLGILLSRDVVGLLPFIHELQLEWYEYTLQSFEYITQVALAFIAFTIGSELSLRLLKRLGKTIGLIVIFETAAAFMVVFLGVMYLTHQPLYISLLLGAIASATAPAATVMVLHEYNAEGPLTSMIMAIVGIDDALALIIFSLIRPIAYQYFSGGERLPLLEALFQPLLEIGGSLALGLAIGYFSQKWVVGFEDKTKKVLTLVVTIVGNSALATSLNFSPLIASMAVGFAYRNFARKNPGIGDYMETLTIPLYALFFILAGTEIRFTGIFSARFLSLAAVYLLARIIGKVGGASLAAWLSGARERIYKYVGLGLFPQSGVAIALAYTVQRDFAASPEVGMLIFNTLLFTAAITEVVGPLFTKYAVFKAGEAREARP